MAHTPTPYHAIAFEAKRGGPEFGVCAKGKTLFFLGKTAEDRDTTIFIAKACNAHDALLAAATRLAREVPCYCDRDRTKPDFKPCGCCDLAKIITQVRTEKAPYEKSAIRAGTLKEQSNGHSS